MIQPFVCIFGGHFSVKQLAAIKKACTPTLWRTKDERKLQEIVRLHRPQVFVTIGKSQQDFPTLMSASLAERLKWMHYTSTEDFLSKVDLLVNVFVNSVVRIRDENLSEKVSAFTSSYNSKNFIHRPLETLLAQTYTNWEWVLYDDSDNDENWEMLKKIKTRDPMRIRIFRSDGNSGVIGHVKQIASSLCRGSLIVVLDHDDKLAPDAFEHLVNAARRFPNAGFFYSNYCFIHEDGTNVEHTDGFALGFGGYRRCWNDDFGKWTNVSRSVPVTDITIRYLVGCPNHYRAWRASAFKKIGGWCADFHVADDYEILVRTFLSCDMVRVVSTSYTQFINKPSSNSDGKHNNFTWIRNAEIQKLWRSIARTYNDRIHQRVLTLQGSDPHYKTWEQRPMPLGVAYHETATHYNYLNEVYEPRDQNETEPFVFVVFCYDKETCSDKGTGQALHHVCKKLNEQTYKNIELMIVSADAAKVVEPWMQRLATADSDKGLQKFVRSKVSYWNFCSTDNHTYSYYAVVNHALKRINTARHTLMLHDDAEHFQSLPRTFLEKCVEYMIVREDVHGVVAEPVPHLFYRAALHRECGFLDRDNVDLQTVISANGDANLIEWQDVVRDLADSTERK